MSPDPTLLVRRLRVVAAASLPALLLAASPSPAGAQSSQQRVYACVTKGYKTLNLATTSRPCPRGQRKISWAVSGPRGGDGAAGSPGAPGQAGAAGPQGPQGAVGPNGSADTPAEILAKLLSVDGAGSGLDADLFQGSPASDFQRRVTGTCPAGSYFREVAANGTVTCEQALAVPLTLAQPDPAASSTALTVNHAGIGNGLDITLSNSGGGGRGLNVTHGGVGPGVFSVTEAGNAIWGISESVSTAAVIGDSPWGETLVGRNSGANCSPIGTCSGIAAVVGRHDGPNGPAVRGFNTDPVGGFGVLGQTGISGGTGVGVRGENVNAANSGNAVEAATNGAGSALYASESGSNAAARAATFVGNVQITGDLTVTGTKSGFQIDDPRAPTERTLTHSPLETDELAVTYSGNVTTGDDGRATVTLPEYAPAVAGDWRYQLTAIGKFGQVIVEREVEGGGRSFVVRSEEPATKVSWTVTGTRHDPQSKRSPITPSAAKTGDAAGKYLDPSLYGQPSSDAVEPPLALEGSSATNARSAAGGRIRLASER